MYKNLILISILMLIICSCGGPSRKLVAEDTIIHSAQDVKIRGVDAEVDLRDSDIRGRNVNVCSDGNLYLPRKKRFGGTVNTNVSTRCE